MCNKILHISNHQTQYISHVYQHPMPANNHFPPISINVIWIVDIFLVSEDLLKHLLQSTGVCIPPFAQTLGSTDVDADAAVAAANVAALDVVAHVAAVFGLFFIFIWDWCDIHHENSIKSIEKYCQQKPHLGNLSQWERVKAFLSNPPPDLMNIVMSSNCQALTVINNSPRCFWQEMLLLMVMQ